MHQMSNLLNHSSLLVVAVLLSFCADMAVGQEPQAYKVRNIHSANFDKQSIDNLRYLQKLARRDGRVLVWIISAAPYDPEIDPTSADYEGQLSVLKEYRDEICKELKISDGAIQFVADGPYFAVDVDARQLRQLVRLSQVKGFWGFENAGYVSD